MSVSITEWAYIQDVLRALLRMQGYLMAKGEKTDSDLYKMIGGIVNTSESRLDYLLKRKIK